MSLHKEVLHPVQGLNLNPTMTRGRFVELAGKAAFAGVMAATGKAAVDLGKQAHSETGVRVFPIKNQRFENLHTPFELGAQPFYLSERFQITIAHRAANNPDDIEKAARAGFSYADGDLLKTDKGLFLSHDGEAKIIGKKPKLLGIPLLGINSDKGRMRALHNPPTLDKTARAAVKSKIGLFLEFKHGIFTDEDLHKIIQIQRTYGMSMIAHGWVMEYIKRGKQIERTYSKNGDSIKWLVVPSYKTWDEAIIMARESDNSGVVTNFSSAEERETELENTTVILGDIETRKDVQNAAGLKVTSGLLGKEKYLAPFLKAA